MQQIWQPMRWFGDWLHGATLSPASKRLKIRAVFSSKSGRCSDIRSVISREKEARPGSGDIIRQRASGSSLLPNLPWGRSLLLCCCTRNLNKSHYSIKPYFPCCSRAKVVDLILSKLIDSFMPRKGGKGTFRVPVGVGVARKHREIDGLSAN